jgi:hypothetical protein
VEVRRQRHMRAARRQIGGTKSLILVFRLPTA